MANTTEPTFRCPDVFLTNYTLTSEIYNTLLVNIIVNSVTCPFSVLMNVLVIVVVTTRHRLRTKYNVLLACVATNDAAVGLIMQPMYVAIAILLMKKEDPQTICTLLKVFSGCFLIICLSLFHHLILLNGERYFAIKRPLQYETTVSKSRIVAASGFSWVLAILPTAAIVDGDPKLGLVAFIFGTIPRSIGIVFILYCQVVLYIKMHQYQRQIADQQINSEVMKKLKEDRKALRTTSILTVTTALSFLPLVVTFSLDNNHDNGLPVETRHIYYFFAFLFIILCCVFYPVIYAIRIRNFRISFIQILTGKSAAEAKEMEKRIFRIRKVDAIQEGEAPMQNGAEQGEG